ncbi:MarR family winged helix-turn-helix transcriptional regulator [Deinococcus sp. UYEF24]
MKDSELETKIAPRRLPDLADTPSGGGRNGGEGGTGETGAVETGTNEIGADESERDELLREVFELQMGMLWLAQKAMRELTARHELHPPHLMILNLLDGRHPDMVAPHEGGLSMSDFSRSLDIPPASATAMIDRMIAQELVERGPSEQDRRVVMVRLTGRGREVIEEITTLWHQVQRDAFTVLSTEQLASHLTLMRRLQEGYLQRFPEDARPKSMISTGGPARSGAPGTSEPSGSASFGKKENL